MSDDTIRIPIETPANVSGAERAIRALERLARAQGQQQKATTGAGAAAERLSRQGAQVAAQQAREAASAAKLAESQNQITKSAAQAALAEQKLQTETARTAAAQDRAASAALRRAQAEQRAARQGQNKGLGPALPRTFAGITDEGSAAIRGELLGIIGPAALATAAIGGLGAAVQGVGDAARDSLNLQQITAGLRTASGSAQTYAEALAIARQNQILYGTSAADAQSALIGLANISRTTGVELTSIDEVVRQLKASDPAATFEDASIALREFLSGDITSLAERFELPRAKLRELADETVPAQEKIRRLNQMLLQSGFSADTAASAVPKATREINQLGVDADRVRVAVGGLVAELAGLAAAGANDGGGITKFADSVEQGGAIVTDALRRIGEGVNPLDAFRAAVRASAEEMLGMSGPAAAAGKSTDDLAGAWGEETKAVQDNTAEKALARAEAELLAEKERDLYDAAQAAAAGSGSIEDAAMRLAAKFPIAADEAAKLIGLLRELAGLAGVPAAAAGKARIAAQGMNTVSTATGTKGGSNEPVKNAPGRAGAGDDQIAQVAAAQRAAKEAAAAQRAYDEAVGGTSVRLQNLRTDLAAATAGSAEYYRIAAEIAGLEDRQGRAGGAASSRAAKAAAKDAREAERAAEQADDIQYKQAERQRDILEKRVAAAQERDAKLADIERTSAMDLAQIAADAAARSAEIEAQASSRLADIRKQRAADLKAIDERAAAEQAQAARDLATTIAGTQAGLRASNAADNLALAGAGDDPALKAREAAQAAREQATQAAAQRAQGFGDATVGQAAFQAELQAIEAKQALDEEYAKRQEELAGNPQALAELEAYYQQAIDAQRAAVEQQIADAQQAADLRVQAREQEKQAVVAAAEEERKAVVAERRKAQEQVAAEAEKQRAAVATKAAEQRAAVESEFQAQNDAITKWADDTERELQRVIDKADEAVRALLLLNSTTPKGASTGLPPGVSVGTRATGGPVAAGQPYIVGEKRPELFVPDTNGTVLPYVPQGAAGGGSAAGASLSVTFGPGSIVQQPGEDGALLAERIAAKVYQRLGSRMQGRGF